jgi:hypothetical protein
VAKGQKPVGGFLMADGQAVIWLRLKLASGAQLV